MIWTLFVVELVEECAERVERSRNGEGNIALQIPGITFTDTRPC